MCSLYEKVVRAVFDSHSRSVSSIVNNSFEFQAVSDSTCNKLSNVFVNLSSSTQYSTTRKKRRGDGGENCLHIVRGLHKYMHKKTYKHIHGISRQTHAHF